MVPSAREAPECSRRCRTRQDARDSRRVPVHSNCISWGNFLPVSQDARPANRGESAASFLTREVCAHFMICSRLPLCVSRPYLLRPNFKTPAVCPYMSKRHASEPVMGMASAMLDQAALKDRPSGRHRLRVRRVPHLSNSRRPGCLSPHHPQQPEFLLLRPTSCCYCTTCVSPV